MLSMLQGFSVLILPTVVVFRSTFSSQINRGVISIPVSVLATGSGVSKKGSMFSYTRKKIMFKCLCYLLTKWQRHNCFQCRFFLNAGSIAI